MNTNHDPGTPKHSTKPYIITDSRPDRPKHPKGSKTDEDPHKQASDKTNSANSAPEPEPDSPSEWQVDPSASSSLNISKETDPLSSRNNDANPL